MRKKTQLFIEFSSIPKESNYKCAGVVGRLRSTKGPHDLAHFFMVHSFGAIIQLVPEQLVDLLLSLESLKTVILTYIFIKYAFTILDVDSMSSEVILSKRSAALSISKKDEKAFNLLSFI